MNCVEQCGAEQLVYELFGSSIIPVTPNRVTIKIQDYDETVRAVDITIENVVEYYVTQSRNLSSGLRSIGGINGDWRQIDDIAHSCLEAFKILNIDGLREEGRRRGIEPRF